MYSSLLLVLYYCCRNTLPTKYDQLDVICDLNDNVKCKYHTVYGKKNKKNDENTYRVPYSQDSAQDSRVTDERKLAMLFIDLLQAKEYRPVRLDGTTALYLYLTHISDREEEHVPHPRFASRYATLWLF